MASDRPVEGFPQTFYRLAESSDHSEHCRNMSNTDELDAVDHDVEADQPSEPKLSCPVLRDDLGLRDEVIAQASTPESPQQLDVQVGRNPSEPIAPAPGEHVSAL